MTKLFCFSVENLESDRVRRRLAGGHRAEVQPPEGRWQEEEENLERQGLVEFVEGSL